MREIRLNAMQFREMSLADFAEDIEDAISRCFPFIATFTKVVVARLFVVA